ncbi:hypothetical protein MUK42_13771 [Musa troglodytarum]|uniref:Uncharacterized protein n=1 Tax=Musa troglodytarum TaxID=320322 RepID=A0A9E7LAX4_9LILI|nr:hypothetical protein MUK42_13771 [Musa troglodytarum]
MGSLPSMGRRSCMAIVTNCYLLLIGVSGGALLSWWVCSFDYNQQMWMGPRHKKPLLSMLPLSTPSPVLSTIELFFVWGKIRVSSTTCNCLFV